ncbi:hypothetical protein ACFDR9_005493 [Janthinobacterium sp. CG_23.3]|uniref:hypothetical protein n=1 Tax=Janthinobacterium sp. CG_23.3 TaxID=3349634 RepID=UPI0038D39F40
MKQKNNAGFRILARDIAQELTSAELEQVNGGACQTVTKVTWKQGSGADAEFVLQCQ